MKVKTCTSLEQSKRLVKWGLSSETADMCYFPVQSIENNVHYNLLAHKEKAGFPAWSLAALFAVLPNKIVSHETAFEGEDAEGINDIYNKRIEPTEDGRYTCCYVGNGCIYECVADNPVDACCELIIKLSELKML